MTQRHLQSHSPDTGLVPIVPSPGPEAHPVPGGKVTVPLQLKVLIFASFLIALGYGLVAPVLPAFARSFDVGASAATLVVSIFAFSRLLFAPVTGRLLTRAGERSIYSAGLLIVALGSVGAGLATSYPALLAARALGGIGSVMFTVAAMGILIRNAPPSIRGRISGYYATSFLLGNILGPVLGALLSGWGMRLPFFLYAGMLLLASLVVLIMLGRVDRQQAQGQARAGGSQQQKPALTLKQAWGFSNYRAALATNFAMGWSIFGVQSSLIPLAAVALLTQLHAGEAGFDPLAAGAQLSGITLATYAAGNALMQIYSGKLSDRYGRRPLVFAGLLWAGTVTILLGWVTMPPFFVGTALLLGVGAALMGPSLQASVSDVIGSQRSGGQPLAIYQMANDIGMIVGPLLAGLIIDQAGFREALGLCGALLLLASLTWLPWRQPRFPQDLADRGYSGR